MLAIVSLLLAISSFPPGEIRERSEACKTQDVKLLLRKFLKLISFTRLLLKVMEVKESLPDPAVWMLWKDLYRCIFLESFPILGSTFQ